MAGSPKKSPLLLLLLLIGIAAFTFLATYIIEEYGSPDKVTDTVIRAKLLSSKDKTAILGDYTPINSNVYSASVYDHKVSVPALFKLPWVKLVRESPNGGFAFTWRIKLTFKALFSVKIDDRAPGDFSIELSARDGSIRFARSESLLIPAQEVELEPGIYIIKVNSLSPLDFFSLSFENVKDAQPQSLSASSDIPVGIEPLYLNLDLRAKDALERFVELALMSSTEAIIKTPKGRVEGTIVDKLNGNHISAGVTLSGRTREHMKGFPSLDVKIKGGVTYNGFSSFKLYKLSTKSGLYDFVFLSVFRDMGFFVPRQELVTLYVNDEYKGIYILMETFSAELFTSQKRLEGDVVGVDSDRMFFDYPFGATLRNKYFHRLKVPGKKKKGSKFFLSTDFIEKLDTDHTARYLSMAALYLMGHGLGVDDLRFYSNPATGKFYPIPRDLNPGLWGTVETYRVYLTHFAWLIDSPVYTIYPTKSLVDYDLDFHGTKSLLDVNASSIGVTDLHFSLASFLSTTGGLSAVNRYLGFYASNRALKALIDKRLINVLSEARKVDNLDMLVRSQLLFIRVDGARFLGNIFKFHKIPEPLIFSDGKVNYKWNIRTAEELDLKLRPSFISPMAYQISSEEHENQFILNFLVEKKVFEMLDSAGVFFGARSFKRVEDLKARATAALPLKPKAYAPIYTSSGEGMESFRVNVVKHLSTVLPDGKNALVLFLVRNATDKVSDYRLNFRDAIANLAPVVNETFKIHSAMEVEPSRATVLQIMNNQFLRGENLRLLAFEIPLSKEAIFYTLKMPEGSLVYFPKYMYVPPKGSGVRTKIAPAGLPVGVVERENSLFIAPGSVVTLERDLVVPRGKSLRVGAGAVIKIAKGRSVKVTGDLFINGTKDKPVRFISSGVEPWGGLYAGGDSTKRVRVELKNVFFDNYGSFPKTRVDELSLNGGVSFYNSKVVIENATFSNAFSEDALNFISSFVELKGTEIINAFSDSIDMDFSNAHIKGLKITGSGGDGLDLSLSLVKIEDSLFAHSTDKGLSVGEMSRVYVTGSSFIGNNMGIANKDQSHLEVSGSIFDGNGTALAEFIKKPAYGRPTSRMRSNTYKNNKSEYEWLGFYSY